MNEPNPVSQKKNLLGNSARRQPENLPVHSSGTQDASTGSLSPQTTTKSPGLDQQKALLGSPYVPGEPLVKGETLFKSENESIVENEDLLGLDLHIGPSQAFARLRRLNWLIVSIITIIVASFLLMAFSQTATLAREVASLPAPLSWIGFASLSVLWLAIGVAVWHLVSSFVRLKRTPGVSMSSLRIALPLPAPGKNV